MALAQQLFALAGVLAILWAFSLTLFVAWLAAYSTPSGRASTAPAIRAMR